LFLGWALGLVWGGGWLAGWLGLGVGEWLDG
jgi:hypothetical protein